MLAPVSHAEHIKELSPGSEVINGFSKGLSRKKHPTFNRPKRSEEWEIFRRMVKSECFLQTKQTWEVP